MHITKDIQEELKKYDRIGSICKEMEAIQEAINKKEGKLHNEIINRWEFVGFLNGLESPQKEECACCFEEMACYLIRKFNPDTCDDKFETGVFPIIRRVIQKDGSFNGMFNPEFVEKFYYDNLEEAKAETDKEAKNNPDLDKEAFALAWIADKLAENIK